MPNHVLALLERPTLANPPVTTESIRYVDPAAPHVSVLDLGATRGDGIFETISVGHGHPQNLTHHLERFARSAAMLDLPEPDLDAWRTAIAGVVERLDPAPEAWVKIVMTRGIEGSGLATGWAYATHSGDFSAARRDGIRVVTLDRGYRHDVARTSPWLLQGAKTLSYAVNRAVFREAARRDADDVIFVSSDGYVLEGPTSTVIIRRGDELLTPGPDLGILDGTTQASLFRFAESIGFTTTVALLTVDDVQAADAAWLVSSVRLAAPVRSLDGEPKTVDIELTARMTEHLLGLRE